MSINDISNYYHTTTAPHNEGYAFRKNKWFKAVAKSIDQGQA